MHRIRLENEEFEGRNNAYLFTGDGPTVLVDAGVATDDVRSQLVDGMAAHGVEVADVDALVLTHWHQDHSGLAGFLQAESGAAVYAHGADAGIVERDEAAWAEMDEIRRRRFESWAIPAEERDVLEGIFAAVARAGGEPVEVTTVSDGETIRAGDETLRTLHSPGHTAGLCSFAIEGRDEAIVGDAVLPVYTPNIGGADLRVERPLETYVETLERIAGCGFDRLHPGHRDPIDDPGARIRTILDHHRERTERVVDVLAEHGPATAWEVSDHLFGDLSDIHILHGPGESWAHLVHLEERGAVARTGREYRLVAEAGVEVTVGDIEATLGDVEDPS